MTESSVTLGTYVYDGQGHRVKKVTNGQTTYFLYDQESRLIVEADFNSTITSEYVYIPDRPLAKIDIDGSSEEVYYYHTDHLGTPLFMTNSSGQKVWSAELLPFGEGYDINEDVDGDQVYVVNNLRLPGQYYDAETGLHYNVMRDYHPLTGRYIESDPIGLMGGINTFAYVEDSPLNWIDPWGLARGEIIYFSRKPGSDFPYHVGFDQGNNQILMLNGGYIRSRGLDQYLTETGYGVLGYADISDYIRADQFEENIIGAKEFLEDNFRDWNPEGTMCIDVMNVGFGDAYNKLKNDIKKKIGDSSDSYYWRRNSTYLKFFKSTGRFRQ